MATADKKRQSALTGLVAGLRVEAVNAEVKSQIQLNPAITNVEEPTNSIHSRWILNIQMI